MRTSPLSRGLLAAALGLALVLTAPPTLALEQATTAKPPKPQGRSHSYDEIMLLRSRLNDGDRLAALRALHYALQEVPDGTTFVWRRKKSPLKGFVRPTAAFRNADGLVCRHIIYGLAVASYVKRIEGIACRDRDGVWAILG